MWKLLVKCLLFARDTIELPLERGNTFENCLKYGSSNSGVTELLTYCLDMLKNRVGVMKIDTRKTFIAHIITGLIERTTDAKLMKALCKVSTFR